MASRFSVRSAVATPAVPVDYTAKDYSGYRDAMLTYAQTAIPEWTTRSPADFGVALVEMLAYCMDILSYYQDRLVSEAYLDTATQRSSVLEIARMLGYTPYASVAAQGQVTLATDAAQSTDVLVPAGTQLITDYQPDLQGPLMYETLQDMTVPASGGAASVPVVEGATQGMETITLAPGSGSQVVSVVDLGASDGSPDQTFVLPGTPVDQSTVRVFVNYPNGPAEYVVVGSLLNAGPTDQQVSLSTDANGNVSIVFGDGLNGYIPENGVEVMAAYRIGGGTRGNLAANALLDVATVISGITVQSSSAMTGGLDAESLDSIRRNAPAIPTSQNRAVTHTDYANLALGVQGVDKASALGQSVSVVTIYILAANNGTPAQGLIDATTQAVQAQAMVGTTVVVQTGSLVPVNFGTTSTPVLVGVMSQYRRTDVQLAVTQALQKLLDPSVTSFQQRVTVAQAYAVVHDLPGVLYVQIPVMARADASQSGTADVVCQPWEVPVAGTINIQAVGGV